MSDCVHERTFSIGGKASDRHNWFWPDGSEGDGYAPNIPGLCGGDYVDLEVCIDCKIVIGFPSADEILELQEEDKANREEQRRAWEERKRQMGW